MFKVILITVFIALWRKKPQWDQDHLDDDESLPTIYWDPEDPKVGETMSKIVYVKDIFKNPLFASATKRPSSHGPKAESPEWAPSFLEPLRHRRMLELEMNHKLQEMLVYLVYLVVIVILSNGNKDVNSFYMKDQLSTTVVRILPFLFR